MSVSDGQRVDANTTNAAFVSRTTDSDTTGKVDLNNADAVSGGSVENIQRELNGQASFTGDSVNDTEDRKPTWTNNEVGTVNDDLKARGEALTVQVGVNTTNIATKVDKVSSTDEAVVRFDGVSGDVQDSNMTIDDSGNVNIAGNLTVQGDTNTIGDSITTDPKIVVNNTGTEASADAGDAGIEVEMSDATNVGLAFDSSLTSKMKIGEVGSQAEVVTVSDQQAITNKDIDGGVASDTSRITVPKGAKATLDALTRKEGTIVYATDEQKFYYDNGVELVEAGSGASGSGVGGINYIDGDAFNFEGGTIGDWMFYDDGAVDEPINGEGAYTTGITFTANTFTPLRGTTDGLFDKPALENRQGQGIRYDFNVDQADINTRLYITFNINDASFLSDVVGVFIYDVTNTRLVDVTSSWTNSRFTGAFSTSGGTAYRLLIHVKTSTTDGVAGRLDNIQVGPDKLLDSVSTGLIGEVVPWANDSVPVNFLECDGAAVSRTVYADLFAEIGTTWGVGDGSTTFNLPNFTDDFLRGDGAGTVGDSQADLTSVNGLSVTTQNLTGSFDTSFGAAIGTVFAAATTGIFTNKGTTNRDTYGNTVNTNDRSAGINVDASHSHSLTGDAETRPQNKVIKWVIRFAKDQGAVVNNKALVNQAIRARIDGPPTNPFTTGSFDYNVLDYPNVVFDVGENFNANGHFVVPETGVYKFTMAFRPQFGTAPGPSLFNVLGCCSVDAAGNFISDLASVDVEYGDGTETLFFLHGTTGELLLDAGTIIAAYHRKEGTSTISAGDNFRTNYFSVQRISDFDVYGVPNPPELDIPIIETDWVDHGPISIDATGSAPTKGTTSIDKIESKREGSDLLLRGVAKFNGNAGGGVSGSGDYLIDLPRVGISLDSNYTFATTVEGSANYDPNWSTVGVAQAAFDSGNNNNDGVVTPSTSTQLKLFFVDSGVKGAWSSTFYELGAAGTITVTFNAKVTIEEWKNSSGVVANTEAASAVNKARYYRNANQTVSTADKTTVAFNDTNFVQGADFSLNTSTGEITVNKTMTAEVKASVRIQSHISEQNIQTINVNGTTSAARAPIMSASLNDTYISDIVQLNKGDVVTIAVDALTDASYTLAGASTVSWVSIEEIPSVEIYGVYQDPFKTQTKFLTADDSSGGVLSDLTFSNLESGKWYRVNGQVQMEKTANGTCQALFDADGLRRARVTVSSTTAEPNQVHHFFFEYQSSGGDLTLNHSVGGVSTMFGNSTRNETWMTVTEIQAKEEFNGW